MAGQTPGAAIMLAWTLYCGPTRCPAWSMHRAPVCTSTDPAPSTTATWRRADPSSPARTSSRAMAASAPAASFSRHFGP